MRFTGHCRCGQVSLEIETPTLPPLYACHCLNCQRWSGSAFGLHMLCGASAVQVVGEHSTYVHDFNGHTSTQYVCATCHTRLMNETSAAPGLRVVRAGVLEGAEQFVPVAHLWTRRKQPWLVLPGDVPQWQESPTPEEFSRALSG